VTKKVMAAPDANGLKTFLHQSGDQLSPGDPWVPAHAAMVMR
jgi:hypothetical protein